MFFLFNRGGSNSKRKTISVDLYIDECPPYSKVIANHGLRGFDAIHLASALTIGSAVGDNLLFACYDEKLKYAAQAEGVDTLPE